MSFTGGGLPLIITVYIIHDDGNGEDDDPLWRQTRVSIIWRHLSPVSVQIQILVPSRIRFCTYICISPPVFALTLTKSLAHG